ncbi:hypothetical protein [Mariprofundus ferrooxydans]|uniref:hypothetical protein n=1 Tax=Mariprofundus ferrooxydans TaxID=314344 RepID=UPI001430AEE8|nr:hypothetical protein [Mariprofundus ferrooxydans]
MLPLIPIAISLASKFLPDLVGHIAGPKAGTVAKNIVDAASKVTGIDASNPDNHDQVMSALAAKPELVAQLQSEFIKLQMTEIQESGSTLRTMLESDAQNPHTTRPKIAYQAFQVVAAATLLIVVIFCYAVCMANEHMVKAIMDGWPFITALLAPFVYLLKAYFGILKVEHSNRLAAAVGHPPATGVADVLAGMFGKGAKQ